MTSLYIFIERYQSDKYQSYMKNIIAIKHQSQYLHLLHSEGTKIKHCYIVPHQQDLEVKVQRSKCSKIDPMMR